MRKPKTTKKKAPAKSRKRTAPAATAKAHRDTKKKVPHEDLCVFAFRLTAKERTAIHKAAGPAKASKFVRALSVAAARNDEATVKAIMKAVQTKA